MHQNSAVCIWEEQDQTIVIKNIIIMVLFTRQMGCSKEEFLTWKFGTDKRLKLLSTPRSSWS